MRFLRIDRRSSSDTIGGPGRRSASAPTLFQPRSSVEARPGGTMTRATVAVAITLLSTAAALACSDGAPTSESRGTPIQLANGVCQYTPTSVALAVDSSVHFFGDSDCTVTKRKMTLTWTNPQTPARLGFGIAA